MRKKEGDSLDGLRLPLFDYTNKIILTIEHYEKKIQEEIDRVKKLVNGKSSGWVKTSRTRPSEIFEFSDVSCLSNVGKERTKKLKQADITKVYQLAALGETENEIKEKIEEIAEATALTVGCIRKLHLQAMDATKGDPPIDVNHLTATNPYQSRYGERWRDEIKHVQRMKKFVCVTDLVTHIVNHSAAAYKGTDHENDWLFYHDALTQMTDKKTIAWMEEKGWLHRWIRPVLGLNDLIIVRDIDGNEKTSRSYRGRPVGDCPEAMPLDNSLFRDFRTSMDRHIGITSILSIKDPLRFSKATPIEVMKTVNRLWDPVTGVSPRSDRIVQDIQRLKENFLLIVEADGAIVDGVADRNGHRKGRGPGQSYHARLPPVPAKKVEDLELHADAQEALWKIDRKERPKWEAKIARLNQ